MASFPFFLSIGKKKPVRLLNELTDRTVLLCLWFTISYADRYFLGQSELKILGHAMLTAVSMGVSLLFMMWGPIVDKFAHLNQEVVLRFSAIIDCTCKSSMMWFAEKKARFQENYSTKRQAIRKFTTSYMLGAGGFRDRLSKC